MHRITPTATVLNRLEAYLTLFNCSCCALYAPVLLLHITQHSMSNESATVQPGTDSHSKQSTGKSYHHTDICTILNYTNLLHYILQNSTSATKQQEIALCDAQQYSKLQHHYLYSLSNNIQQYDVLLVLVVVQCAAKQYIAAQRTLTTALSQYDHNLLLQCIATDVYCRLHYSAQAVRYADTAFNNVQADKNFIDITSQHIADTAAVEEHKEFTPAAQSSNQLDSTPITNVRDIDAGNRADVTHSYAGLTKQQMYTLVHILHARAHILATKYVHTALQYQHHYNIAQHSLEQLLKIDSNNTYIITQLAYVCACTLQYDSALSLVKQALSSDTNSSSYQLWNMLALLLATEQQYADALTVCNTVIKQHNVEQYNIDILNLLFTKAYVCIELQRFEDALHAVAQAAQLIGGSQSVHIERKTPNANTVITHVVINVTNTDKISKQAQADEQRSSYQVRVLLLLVQVYVLYNDANKHDNLLPLAVHHVQRAQLLVRTKAEQSEVLRHSALIAEHSKQQQSAANLYEQSLQYNPNNVQALLSLARLHIQSPARSSINESVAYNHLQHVLAIDAYSVPAHKLLAQLYTVQDAADATAKHEKIVKQLSVHQPVRPYAELLYMFVH